MHENAVYPVRWARLSFATECWNFLRQVSLLTPWRAIGKPPHARTGTARCPSFSGAHVIVTDHSEFCFNSLTGRYSLDLPRFRGRLCARAPRGLLFSKQPGSLPILSWAAEDHEHLLTVDPRDWCPLHMTCNPTDPLHVPFCFGPPPLRVPLTFKMCVWSYACLTSSLHQTSYSLGRPLPGGGVSSPQSHP